ncbi:MAG: hypothetical protein AB1540_12340 [Bdellovibrionota bacterium]
MMRLTLVLALSAMACSTVSSGPSQVQERSNRHVKIALEMLNRESNRYNPTKGKAYLEALLSEGELKSLDVPASILLELLRSEKTATQKSRTLEEKIQILKEIDLEEDT